MTALYADGVETNAQQKLQYEKEQVQKVTAAQGAAGQIRTDVQLFAWFNCNIACGPTPQLYKSVQDSKPNIVLGAVVQCWC